jgi:hypothetical protein
MSEEETEDLSGSLAAPASASWPFPAEEFSYWYVWFMIMLNIY